MLRKMGIKLDRLEDDILEGRSSEIVRDISNAKQEIINFRRIVRPQRAVLRDLERTSSATWPREMEVYFDDVSDAAERIWAPSRTTRRSSRRSSRPTRVCCRIV
jgi:magnesium transporter